MDTILKKMAVESIINNPFETSAIIGITGNIASGKSTMAIKLMQTYKTLFPDLHVQTISTDNFLKKNSILKKENIFNKKGFPESYDQTLIDKFIDAIHTNSQIFLPVYDHQINDIVPDKKIFINQPDILIIEGLIVLQPDFYPLLNYSIFIDSSPSDNYEWFKQRCSKLKLQEAYHMNDKEFYSLMDYNWTSINLVNFNNHILPLKNLATRCIRLNVQHQIESLV
ncbi:hypothetical protein [Pediococcus stilesii]|uniref:Phosphoribulokinase/uridine kinase domain-containing protein n=1 Tax=Pediococcus stilesii TaxID=331679 RepID=A0A5R9BYL6_9LACO|nr:hypothetical protein [Pediococcus stilesii]TLQ05789.1 hypothetical protein FEZ51_01000 [Pediococcus stilesii]